MMKGKEAAYKNWSVAFVEPRYSLNIGYVARVVANFGLEELVLVYPSLDRGLKKARTKEAIKYAATGDIY